MPSIIDTYFLTNEHSSRHHFKDDGDSKYEAKVVLGIQPLGVVFNKQKFNRVKSSLKP